MICTILEVTNNFPSTLKDPTTNKPTFLNTEVSLDLLIPLISIPPTIVPSWNRHINNYVSRIFGFANKYIEKNGAILIFHDDDPHIFKEIKSFSERNGYEIHFRWAVINFLLRMSSGIKGKMVIPLLNSIYITYHSIESYWTNSYHSQSCRLD